MLSTVRCWSSSLYSQLAIVICRSSHLYCQVSTVSCQASHLNTQLSTVICWSSYLYSQLSDVICQSSHVYYHLSTVICRSSHFNSHLSTVICQSSQIYSQLSTVRLFSLSSWFKKGIQVEYWMCISSGFYSWLTRFLQVRVLYAGAFTNWLSPSSFRYTVPSSSLGLRCNLGCMGECLDSEVLMVCVLTWRWGQPRAGGGPRGRRAVALEAVLA